MNRKIELLAPGGDIDAIKAAILAGANAIYCGLDKFNARNRAANISLDNLQGILRLAHQHDCEIFITLNILIVENEIPALIDLLNKLINTSVDGLIVQDLGMLYLLNKHFKGFDIHASTQMTTHNKGQIKFLSEQSVSRVNLSRELNLSEIKDLATYGHKNQVLTEVFVHGSNCISFSGLCYISSVYGGNSGNRGRCSQPCRDRYLKTPEGKDYPLNLKDNSAFYDLKALYEAGVYSLKIEGRIKKSDYVYTVVNTWKKNIQALFTNQKPDNSALYKVFNRDFSNTFLKGDIKNDMFIDNPRDHSIQHLSALNPRANADKLEEAHLALYAEKEEVKHSVEEKIKELNADKIPLSIHLYGKCGNKLKLSIETEGSSFELFSETALVKKGSEALNKTMVFKRLKAINDTAYFIEEINMTGLDGDLFIPFKALTVLKKRLLFILNDSKEQVELVHLAKLEKSVLFSEKPKLSVLVASPDELSFCDEDCVDVYFQLPNSLEGKQEVYLELFRKNRSLIPWFPSVIIGEAYQLVVDFLNDLKPAKIVSNNTGIAYEASKKGIAWVAGPQLNLTNSYSLLCLKEKLNCSGAFISNELNRNQIKQIRCSERFDLHYSIYHPIELMTSRQCLFHQVTGCEKNRLDDTCIQNCNKTTTITNLKDSDFFIEKSRGNYHKLYNDKNFLNTAIVEELPQKFSNYMIDLRAIETGTAIHLDKTELIQLFKSVLEGELDSEKKLQESILSTTCDQYKKGI